MTSEDYGSGYSFLTIFSVAPPLHQVNVDLLAGLDLVRLVPNSASRALVSM